MLKHNDFLLAAQVLAGSIRDAIEGKDVSIQRGQDEDAEVVFQQNGCEIKIVVSDFWMYPDEICYFVNAKHENGNFSCQSGTNSPMRAAINVGVAIGFANVSGDPIQSEDF